MNLVKTDKSETYTDGIMLQRERFHSLQNSSNFFIREDLPDKTETSIKLNLSRISFISVLAWFTVCFLLNNIFY